MFLDVSYWFYRFIWDFKNINLTCHKKNAKSKSDIFLLCSLIFLPRLVLTGPLISDTAPIGTYVWRRWRVKFLPLSRAKGLRSQLGSSAWDGMGFERHLFCYIDVILNKVMILGCFKCHHVKHLMKSVLKIYVSKIWELLGTPILHICSFRRLQSFAFSASGVLFCPVLRYTL